MGKIVPGVGLGNFFRAYELLFTNPQQCMLIWLLIGPLLHGCGWQPSSIHESPMGILTGCSDPHHPQVNKC